MFPQKNKRALPVSAHKPPLTMSGLQKMGPGGIYRHALRAPRRFCSMYQVTQHRESTRPRGKGGSHQDEIAFYCAKNKKGFHSLQISTETICELPFPWNCRNSG
jgi:hypothetical protein